MLKNYFKIAPIQTSYVFKNFASIFSRNNMKEKRRLQEEQTNEKSKQKEKKRTK